MRKLVLILSCILVCATVFGQSSIYIKGQNRVVDTLEHKQIGPGVVYTRANVPSLPLNFYTLSVDMDNAYNRVETFQAQNTTGKTEGMTTVYNRLTTSTQKSLAAINGNFWIVSGQGLDNLVGVPHSLSARNGEMVTADPNSWNKGHGDRGIAVIDEDKKVWIDEMTFDGAVTIEGVGSLAISQINRDRDANQLVFFNDYSAATRSGDTGIEVFIKLVSDQVWSVNRDVECEVVSIVKDKGANAIPKGQAVLSAEGTSRAFLENLSVGSKLKVRQGVYTATDNLRPFVAQILAGNALVMKDGVLTDRNTNEAYNSQLYPRTGIGASADGKKLTLIVIDKAGASVGATTETMCEILKASGSVSASSLDGGGSAQMMLGGKIVSSPSDGRERAVANGWMLFSTAPQTDTEVAELKFFDYQLKVPKLASYKPVVMAYNKYGALISEDLQGVQLSCDPSLGTISQDGSTFTAVAGSGLLTAKYQGVEVSKNITILDGDIVMALDSVVIDDKLEYPIEVYSIIGTDKYHYDPASASWSVDDPSICSVTNGVLRGLKNGATYVRGTLGTFTDSIKVNVEIADAYSMPVTNDYTEWTLNSISAVTNMRLEPTAEGVDFKFTYNTGRYPYVEMKKRVSFYSIPDTLRLTINSSIPVSSAVVHFMANNLKTVSSLTTPALTVGADYEVSVPFDKYFDVNDPAVYPIRLSSLYFNIGTGTVSGKEYAVKLKDFSLIYNSKKGSSIDEETLDADLFSVYPNPVSGGYLYLNAGDTDFVDANVEIYGVSGQLLQKETLSAGGEQARVDVQNLKGGVYILKINYGGLTKVARFVVQ